MLASQVSSWWSFEGETQDYQILLESFPSQRKGQEKMRIPSGQEPMGIDWHDREAGAVNWIGWWDGDRKVRREPMRKVAAVDFLSLLVLRYFIKRVRPMTETHSLVLLEGDEDKSRASSWSKKRGQKWGRKVKWQRGLSGSFLNKILKKSLLFSASLDTQACRESVSPQQGTQESFLLMKRLFRMGTNPSLALCLGPCVWSLTYWKILSIIECLFVSLCGLLKFLSGAHAVSGEKCKNSFFAH